MLFAIFSLLHLARREFGECQIFAFAAGSWNSPALPAFMTGQGGRLPILDSQRRAEDFYFTFNKYFGD